MVEFYKACTDSSLEQEGVWVGLSGIFSGIEVKVARVNNKKTQDLFETLMKPYRKYQKPHAPKAPENITKEISDVGDRVYAETILLDWRNIEEDGKPVAYSTHKGMEYLKNKDFLAQIQFLSGEAETFRAVEIEDNAKNLKKVSSGS